MPTRLQTQVPEASRIIVEHRNRLGLTQAALAMKLGTSSDTVGRIEAGTYGTVFRARVRKLIAVLKIKDPGKCDVLMRAAEKPPRGDRARDAVRTLHVVHSGETPLAKDDPLIVAMSAAVESGGVEGDIALELTKQIVFLRGLPWHTF